jgi:hypothetical protein
MYQQPHIQYCIALYSTCMMLSSTLERLEQFAKESRRGMENYVGASARNVGVRFFIYLILATKQRRHPEEICA